ncbi:MAG: ribonuclease R [Clostridium sp.]|uniref:ribonuclease R n=1 Tax=Clostridium sp. TaxID=1506 RepID=UPI002A891AEF|nr:ribonuclease R [Clostridium sp.]MDY5096778.1 ribonuclease R [Clostridium sp.]
MSIKDILLKFMNEPAYKPMHISELAKIFDISKRDARDFQDTIKAMEKEGLIIKTNNDKVALPERMGMIVGKLSVHQKGFGFLIPDDEEHQDVFIPSSFINGALHGDRVMVQITKEDIGKKKCEGEVVKIIDRANKTVIGVFESSRNFGFVVPEDKRIQNDIFIPKAKTNGAEDGDVVIVEIIEWAGKRRNPEGKVIDILGKKGDKGIDILTIIKKHGLPEEFPPKVQKYAEGIEEEIPKSEYKRRVDLRDVRMVTIDGEDAKDLDDAVSIERLENGNYKLGVHIADVSNYVKELNPLDKEALKRGTSVYLIDRVIPMLPRELSNGICSLNPKVDRLTLSCIMTIDKKGKVLDHEIVESIIRTDERMTYTDVTKILKDHDEELINRYDYLYDDFKAMEELCNILRAKRLGRGAIDFNFEESKIILNENGKPIDIKPYDREIANRMIEEFMLVCNETVAEHMYWANVPFVYRIHEDPDEDKLQHFSDFIYNMGYSLKSSREVHPKALQAILEKVQGKKEETVVSTLLLRSMMQAKYSPECVGHFGLAAKYYCHFTSPIRRYPDLMIHRIIKEFINGKIDPKRSERLSGIVDYASKQSSDMERRAQDAEREVDDLKKAEYMSERIGEQYHGIISSVTNFGFFVELPNTIEGLVHITELDDDYYVYDERHLSLIGELTKKIYRLGDEVKIKVDRVNIDTHDIYFKLVENEKDEEVYEDLEEEFEEVVEDFDENYDYEEEDSSEDLEEDLD